MKKFNTILAILAFVFSISLSSSAGIFGKSNSGKSAHYTLTPLHLTPKQFIKGIKAEKREIKHQQTSSFHKMMKKRHGSRFYRWLHKTF